MMPTGMAVDMSPPIDSEDIFKEIARQLYGEGGILEFPAIERKILAPEYRNVLIDDEFVEAERKAEDHTTFGDSSVLQSGFPPPESLNTNIQLKTNTAAEDKWTVSKELLQWTQSRIASYNPTQNLFKCAGCDCVGVKLRIAKHWLHTHSNVRAFKCPRCEYESNKAHCITVHLARKHAITDDRHSEALFKTNPVLDEITKYLQRLKTRVDTATLKMPLQMQYEPRTSATPPVPPSPVQRAAAVPKHPYKRYCCTICPYSTYKRGHFARHENVHRGFKCCLCQQQFKYPYQVKSHFHRVHRDRPYDISRIQSQVPKQPSGHHPKEPVIRTEYVRQTRSKKGHPILVKTKTQPPRGSVTQKSQTSKNKVNKRYSCSHCSWTGVNISLYRSHINKHIKPYVCSLCYYKGARAVYLTNHAERFHNKKACVKCCFLADDSAQLAAHVRVHHHNKKRK